MKFTARLVALLSIGAACVSLSLAQVKPAKADQLRVVQMNNISFTTLLAQLAADFEVTISLETDPAQQPIPVNVDLRSVNFWQLMDGLMKAEPGYQWRERDGGIEVYPVKAASSFLDTPIQTYQARNINRETAVWNLLALPEVQAQWLSMSLKPRAPYPASEKIKDEKLTLSLTGVTLRQALNKIAEETGARFWVFRRFPDGTFELTTSSHS